MNSEKIRLAIIGSRDFIDYEMMKSRLDKILSDCKFNIGKIVSGGAKGADSLGERYAIENNIETFIIKPEWGKYGRSAGMIRNSEIINNSDVVIAFWNGSSSGTKDSIVKAEKQGKTVIVEYV